jgi:hypothetical protein
METLSLSKDFQGAFVGVSNRIFHITVVHLQGNREQCTREVIESRDNIERFHERFYRPPYSAQPIPDITGGSAGEGGQDPGAIQSPEKKQLYTWFSSVLL